MSNNEIIGEVRRIILKHANPSRIYLYGSQATGMAGAVSDIDIAYDDKECHSRHLIEEEVQNLPSLLKIDVTNLAFAEERFRNRVLATGRVIYSADKRLRFEDGLHNFRNALERFVAMIDKKEQLYEEGFGDIYLDLAVKRFEFTYEMSWKAIKRCLDFLGIQCMSPRACFKEAYAQGIIKDENIWLEMIEQRNLTSHVYNEAEISGLLERTDAYKDVFAELLRELEKRFEEQV